jgi:hypothetical protein
VWIADTWIECDLQRFGGYLKVSVEEQIIAGCDDRHLVNNPGRLLLGSADLTRRMKRVQVDSHLGPSAIATPGSRRSPE